MWRSDIAVLILFHRIARGVAFLCSKRKLSNAILIDMPVFRLWVTTSTYLFNSNCFININVLCISCVFFNFLRLILGRPSFTIPSYLFSRVIFHSFIFGPFWVLHKVIDSSWSTNGLLCLGLWLIEYLHLLLIHCLFNLRIYNYLSWEPIVSSFRLSFHHLFSLNDFGSPWIISCLKHLLHGVFL